MPWKIQFVTGERQGFVGAGPSENQNPSLSILVNLVSAAKRVLTGCNGFTGMGCVVSMTVHVPQILTSKNVAALT